VRLSNPRAVRFVLVGLELDEKVSVLKNVASGFLPLTERKRNSLRDHAQFLCERTRAKLA
jgi:hypothetical protein